ncbi:2-isopropylmalate synthase [Frankia sp. AiPs1]|uniref:LeuA family protein n=1 Tax=Frankia sp. AiPa1 TaxID=573492 RepID=UPI00202AD862|nr:homocitrate synthase [Frankia sp. AiPa1]MCL9758111.1 homocitrate synthase [Frankia sp. AiPa1]
MSDMPTDSSPRRITFYDTTLRDGEQAPGNTMNPDQKLALALRMEQLGIDVIETGFPSSSAADQQATRLISAELTSARFSTLSRAVPRDIDMAVEAGGLERHQVEILATGSDLHLEHKRGITRAQGERETTSAVRYARSLGVVDVAVGIEDASRGDHGLICSLVAASIESGATTIVLADTTGCATPAEFGALVRAVREVIPPSVVLSTHCHNDLGLAVANTLAAIEAGADEVQVALAGIGERAGNTALEEVAAVLHYKGAALGVRTSLDTRLLYQAFELLSATIALPAPRNKAIFGSNAFSTQAGIHQDGILRDPRTYEYVEPALFGRERRLLVGRHSGRNILRHLFAELGLPADSQQIERLYADHIEDRGEDCLDLTAMSAVVRARLGRVLASAKEVRA